ncbi:hypothetical protein [Spongiibacter tropicus]|uniref:hypothetical protein n=1 Tax=Spongiibacter tropicus TaxID=454602 RepID=UPI0035BE42C4
MSSKPDWVLPETIRWLKTYKKTCFASRYSSKAPEILDKCVYSDALSAKKVWEKASKLEATPENGQRWLLDQIRNSLPKDDLIYMTKSEAEAWREELRTSLVKVTQLIERAPANYYNIQRVANRKFLEEEVGALKANMPRSFGIFMPHILPRYFHSYLEAVNSSDVQYNQVGFGRHVNSEYAERAYFVGSLSAAYKGKTGQSKWQSVADLTSIAFDCNFSKEEARRLAQTLKGSRSSLLAENPKRVEKMVRAALKNPSP